MNGICKFLELRVPRYCLLPPKQSGPQPLLLSQVRSLYRLVYISYLERVTDY